MKKFIKKKKDLEDTKADMKADKKSGIKEDSKADTGSDSKMRKILEEQGAIKKRGAGRPKKK